MKKVLLIIFDGFGEAPAGPGNAITLAKTPNLNALRSKYPFSLLQAAGEAVGLVPGTMGGSEVGHFTMGAGRVVPQFLFAINQDIANGAFFKKEPLKKAFQDVKKSGKKLHLLGMISDKGIHSHQEHLFALLEWAKKEGLKKVFVHAIADGRDVEAQSVKKYLQILQSKMSEIGVGRLATLVGRYYAMDRDTDWDRTNVSYRLMTKGEGAVFENPNKGVEKQYQEGLKNDQYMKPILINREGLVETGDTIIFFNFRTDRPRQLTSAFADPDFNHFERAIGPVHFVCMGPYSTHAPVVYHTPQVQNNLASFLASHKITQLRVAETDKYAHLTYFFNSQIEDPFPLEDRVHIHTPKVKTHDEKPALASREITSSIISAMQKGSHQVIMANYANGDLVGHTGNLKATIRAIESLDDALGALYAQAQKSGYVLCLTGDHGNAEEMFFADGSVRPSHTTNPVIFLVADSAGTVKHVKNGGLADVAPTILKLLDLKPPKEMTGKSLI